MGAFTCFHRADVLWRSPVIDGVRIVSGRGPRSTPSGSAGRARPSGGRVVQRARRGEACSDGRRRTAVSERNLSTKPSAKGGAV